MKMKMLRLTIAVMLKEQLAQQKQENKELVDLLKQQTPSNESEDLREMKQENDRQTQETK